jgi:hypothetical protein
MNIKTSQFGDYRVWSTFVCGNAYVTTISFQIPFDEVVDEVLRYVEEQDAAFPGMFGKTPFFCLKSDLIDMPNAMDLIEKELVNIVIGG